MSIWRSLSAERPLVSIRWIICWIVVSPDRSEWWRKDEDEFREAEAIGVYSAEEARAIRAEGERVIESIQDNQSPYCDSWKRWSPSAKWEIPALPAGWGNMVVGVGSL